MDDIQRFFGGLSLSYTSSKIDAARSKTWKSTGVVALREANLKALPSAVTELGPLARTLDASNNRIVELPPNIGNLVNLQRLVLAGNRLASFPDSLRHLQALRVLDLNNNHLTSIPPIIGALFRVEKLSLAHNNLRQLPPLVGALTKLSVLDVSHNELQDLPSELGDCAALEELRLQSNHIAHLPASLSGLKKLKLLLLDNNKVAELPPSLLLDCGALHTLSLHGNVIKLDRLEQMEGYESLEGRRREKVDKQIAGNVMITSKNLEQGIER